MSIAKVPCKSVVGFDFKRLSLTITNAALAEACQNPLRPIELYHSTEEDCWRRHLNKVITFRMFWALVFTLSFNAVAAQNPLD
jgi:hypothetical protein